MGWQTPSETQTTSFGRKASQKAIVWSQGLHYLLFDCLEYPHLYFLLWWKIPVVLTVLHLGSEFSWGLDSLAFHHRLNYEHIPNTGLFHLWSVKFFLHVIHHWQELSRLQYHQNLSILSYACTQHTSWRNYENNSMQSTCKWYPEMTEIQWLRDLTRWEKLVTFYTSLLICLHFTNLIKGSKF